jgi:anti-sigma factor RsiW
MSIPDTHAEAWSLLPWLANGRIQPADREWVEAHVHTCAECRAELAAQRALASNMRDAGNESGIADADEQRSFDKLWSRIEAAETAGAVATGTQGAVVPVRAPSRTVRWLAAAVIVQGIGLALFGFNSLREGSAAGDGKFVTVTSTAPVRAQAPSISVVFAPEASIGSINTLLEHQGLTLVSGPGLSGNFTAALSPDAVASGASAESVAAVISRDPNVTFAQPIAR